MRDRRCERQGIAGFQLVLLEADPSAERAFDDHGHLAAVVSYDVLVQSGAATPCVEDLEKVDVQLRPWQEELVLSKGRVAASGDSWTREVVVGGTDVVSCGNRSATTPPFLQ